MVTFNLYFYSQIQDITLRTLKTLVLAEFIFICIKTDTVNEEEQNEMI